MTHYYYKFITVCFLGGCGYEMKPEVLPVVFIFFQPFRCFSRKGTNLFLIPIFSGEPKAGQRLKISWSSGKCSAKSLSDTHMRAHTYFHTPLILRPCASNSFCMLPSAPTQLLECVWVGQVCMAFQCSCPDSDSSTQTHSPFSIWKSRLGECNFFIFFVPTLTD